jgi:YqjK-like protein
LVAESDLLRGRLTGSAGALRRALAPAQIATALLDGVRRHPALATGAIVALVALRPRRIWKLLVMGAGGVTLALRAAPALSTAMRLVKKGRRTARVRP